MSSELSSEKIPSNTKKIFDRKTGVDNLNMKSLHFGKCVC